jgi:hypothetical protein
MGSLICQLPLYNYRGQWCPFILCVVREEEIPDVGTTTVSTNTPWHVHHWQVPFSRPTPGKSISLSKASSKRKRLSNGSNLWLVVNPVVKIYKPSVIIIAGKATQVHYKNEKSLTFSNFLDKLQRMFNIFEE